jgi:hypothetical protein
MLSHLVLSVLLTQSGPADLPPNSHALGEPASGTFKGQEPGAQNPNGNPPGGAQPSAFKNPPGDDDGDWGPMTFSAGGRIPFPMGSMRLNTFSGGSTVHGENLRYDQLLDTHGWGAAGEFSIMLRSRSDQEGKADRRGLGLFLSGQYDQFRGEAATLSSGEILRVGQMDVESGFVGLKDYEFWGGGFFSEFRAGGGAIHYQGARAELTSGGVTSDFSFFREGWGVAAEIGLRAGFHLFNGFSVYAGGEGRAAQGPHQAEGLPFSMETSTFFTVAAEAGIEITF